MNKLVIYTDAGSRGNPGPAAVGIVISNQFSAIRKYSKFIGQKTNNQAEYEAVVFALEQAKRLKAKELKINLDSELVYKQLTHQYKIKDKKIQPLFIKVWNLCLDFDEVVFRHIPREQNKQADELVNKKLDEEG